MPKILATIRFRNEIDRILKRGGIEEIKRHANVSTRNRHYCKDCFCCACLDYLNATK